VFDDFIYSAAARYDVPVPWIQTVIEAESSFNPRAFRAEPQINDASYGLMQLLTSTARGDLGYTGSNDGLFDPETNINLGTRYLAQLRARWGDDLRAVYSAYNSGNGNNYKTNPQVAANVQRVLNILTKYTTAAVENVTGAATNFPEATALAALIVGVLLAKWAGVIKK
jgi:soluble lytic murein transglycosylase-like protein